MQQIIAQVDVEYKHTGTTDLPISYKRFKILRNVKHITIEENIHRSDMQLLCKMRIRKFHQVGHFSF